MAGAAIAEPHAIAAFPVEIPMPAPLAALVCLLAFLPAIAAAQKGDGTDVAVTAHVFKPAKVEASAARIAALKLPEGFTIRPFAEGLKNARILAVSPQGRVYVSRREQGDVLMLEDADRDGRADGAAQVVARRAGAHGIAIHEGRFYLVTVKEIFVADIGQDGRLGALRMLVGDLPDAGQHADRTLAFGPDGWIYLSVGSTCNACNESNPENAALLRVAPDGSSRTIFASGLRNTIGFDWHPESGELWGMDQGIDDLGNGQQPEELNRLERDRLYGWPHVWGKDSIHPQTNPKGGLSKAQWRAISTPMALGYTAHAAPMQMAFYRGGNFPAAYHGDAFVAMRGSWNRKPASGYEVVRVRFDQGQPRAIEPFVTGFLVDGGRTHFARPVGLAAAPDGALLLADDANGVIYRIAYAESAQAGAPRNPPADRMREQMQRGNGVPLALQREETRTQGVLQVNSPTIRQGEPIPLLHSEYADGVSPELAWTRVEGAKSYALLMEDPDASPITPFVHWVVWNIPAGLTALPEGLQEQMRLTEPDGLMQGKTSRGSPGYFGPRPPAGDPPHRYHFQVLALDRMLDLKPGATRDDLLKAAAGHVLAKGELMGTFAKAEKPLK